jgi:hypothetical protein
VCLGGRQQVVNQSQNEQWFLPLRARFFLLSCPLPCCRSFRLLPCPRGLAAVVFRSTPMSESRVSKLACCRRCQLTRMGLQMRRKG